VMIHSYMNSRDADWGSADLLCALNRVVSRHKAWV
jgi:hypothetical protein